MERINAVDLFCGAGGLTRGLLDAGIDVKAGIDVEKSCRFPYEFNNGATFINKSIQEISGAEIRRYFDGAEKSLLAGCAPCQTFSALNDKSRDERQADQKWSLLLQFERLVKEAAPDYVAFENVAPLAKETIFKNFVARLERELRYKVWYNVINCADLGIPQARKRLILLASNGAPVEFKATKERKTVKDAIGFLPKLNGGAADPNDALHRAQKLNDVNAERIRRLRQGENWDDLPDELKSPGMRRNAKFKTRWSRLDWNEPATTITTFFYTLGCGRFGHPDQDRALSLREGALLQTFPRSYQFEPDEKQAAFRTVGKMIGNAVPCKLGELIGRSFMGR